jgi:CheY-like chemotaxis protein
MELDDSSRPSPHHEVVEDSSTRSPRTVTRSTRLQTGAEALRLCDQARHDLILSDLRMPNMDGAALYQELRLRYWSAMPRMSFVTAQAHSLDHAGFLAATSMPVLPKPFTVDGLRTAVSQVLSQGA